MKGIYIVDADMDFVHILERLILRNLPDCKTLGHNFKGNDFLNKIKQQPDILKKIDLLIVNPKLNDMTGLALVEKVQGYKKDLNVCITLKDNIKQFFINDLSEKGLEHVLIYPNNDEYFIENLQKIFKKIEAEKSERTMRKSVINNNVSSSSNLESKEKPEDVFNFLNSEEFLNQFNLDNKSDDFFLNNTNVDNNALYDKHNEKLHQEETYSNTNKLSENYISSNEIVFNNEPQSTPQEFNFGYEESQTPSFDFNEVPTPSHDYSQQQEPVNNFNFGYEEPSVPSFNNEPQSAPQEFNFGYEEPQAPSFDFNETPAPSYDYNQQQESVNNFNFGYEEPSVPSFNNEPQSAPQEFNFGYEEPQAPSFDFNETPAPSYDHSQQQEPVNNFNFGYEEPSVPSFNNEPKSAPQEFNFGYEEPQTPSYDFNKVPTPSYDYSQQQEPVNNFNFGYEEPSVPSFNNEPKSAPQEFNFGYEEPQTPSYDFNKVPTPSYDYSQQQEPVNNFNFGHEESSVPNFNNEPQSTPQEFSFGYEEPQAPSYNLDRTSNNGSEEFKSENNKFTFRQPDFNSKPVDPIEYSYEPINPQMPTQQGKAKMEQPKSNRSRFGFGDSPVNANFNPDGSRRTSNVESNNYGLDMSMFGVDSNKPKEPQRGFNNSGTNSSNSHIGFGEKNVQFNDMNSSKNHQETVKPAQGYYDSPPISNQRREHDMYSENFNPQSRENQIKGLLDSDKANNLAFKPQIGISNQQEHYTHEKGKNFNEIPTFAKQIIHFFSTKGGIGKTTACVNAAIQLAKYSKKRICLVDFDLTNANLHTHLGMLDVTYDLTDISNFSTEIDGHSLSRIITPFRVKDKNNASVEFDVIVGFREMVMRQRFNEDEVDRILSILEEMYDIVIVDSHPVYTDVAVSTILKKATKIVFITEQDMTALGGTRDFILAAAKYRIPPEKIYLVLNRYKSNTSTFTKKRLETTLGKKIMTVLPFDIDASREAVNTNMPITLSKPDSELAKSYFEVAKIIDPSLNMPEEKKSFFSFGKK